MKATRENIEKQAKYCEEISLSYLNWAESFKDKRDGRHSISDTLLDDLIKDRRELEILGNLTSKKPSIAIYGASQSGKSLFVGRLLESGNKESVLLNSELDFLKDLNPQTGVEATSVVTRFTINPTSNENNNTVIAKLLNRSDLLKAIARGFRGEFQFERVIREDDLLDFFKNLGTEVTEKDQSWCFDILDTFTYIKGDFDNNTLSFDSYILPALLRKYPLSHKQYVELCAYLFWGASVDFTSRFIELLEIINEIKLGSIYPDWNALTFILRSDAPDTIGDSSWNEYGIDPKTLILCKGGSRKYELKKIQSVICELEVPIDNQLLSKNVSALFNKVDVLDIPGAISDAGRAKISLDQLKDEEELVFNAIKRGRVGYFFDKYSDEKQIINLIYMQKWGNIQARGDVGPQINAWGKAIFSERWPLKLSKEEYSKSPLFVVMTQIDKGIVWDKNPEKGDFDAVIHGELSRHLDSFMGSFGKDNKPFDNTYLLRHPGKCDQLDLNIDFDSWGKAFSGSKYVQKHIQNYKDIWSSIFNDDGGLDYLLNKIIDHIDEQIYLDNLADILSEKQKKINDQIYGMISQGDGAQSLDRLKEVCDHFSKWLQEDHNLDRSLAFRKEIRFQNGMIDLTMENISRLIPQGTEKSIDFYEKRVTKALGDWEASLYSSDTFDRLSNHNKNLGEAISTVISLNKNHLLSNHLKEISEKIKTVDTELQTHWSASKKNDYIATIFDDYILWAGMRDEIEMKFKESEFSYLSFLARLYNEFIIKRLIDSAQKADQIQPPGHEELVEISKRFNDED